MDENGVTYIYGFLVGLSKAVIPSGDSIIFTIRPIKAPPWGGRKNGNGSTFVRIE